MIGIGIDTGGTCTDISVYDHDHGLVLASAKTRTTREDLKLGILEALKQIPASVRDTVSSITLSTTLATNACVEGKGGRAGLVLLGAHPKVVEQYGSEYGLPPVKSILLVNAKPGDTLPDPEYLAGQLVEKFSDCDNLAVVQLSPEKDGAGLEKQMAQLIRNTLNIPATLGSSLFSELNILSRAASTLLNARLVPIMKEFLDAVQEAMSTIGLKVPLWIVRSDGTLMSGEFAAEHPVETLLCGPAASVIGARRLSQTQDALIVDMGGTTTDVSVVRNGYPLTAPDGIQIGPWHTMVHGVYIHTIGLGGDTRITISSEGTLTLDSRRCIPLCALASRYPQILDHLRALGEGEDYWGPHAHEYLVLTRKPAENKGYSSRELRLCQALEAGPLPLRDAANLVEDSTYSPFTERLEQDGVVLRSGLTPTDIMHIRGGYQAWDTAASRYAVQYLGRRFEMDVEEYCDQIDALIVKKMAKLLIGVMLKNSEGFPVKLKADSQLDALSEYIYDCAKNGTQFTELIPKTRAALVGIGAPTHFYLPAVGKLLNLPCIIPEHAPTANAFGAAVSRIGIDLKLEIWPREGMYALCGGKEDLLYKTTEEAIAAGKQLIEDLVRTEARKRGALGELDVQVQVQDISVPTQFGEVYVRTDITAKAAAASI